MTTLTGVHSKMLFSENFKLKNEIMSTLLEIGVMSVGEAELELRVQWYKKDGSFLTYTENHELKLARGQKVTAHEKKKYAKEILHYQWVKDFRKKLEKDNK